MIIAAVILVTVIALIILRPRGLDVAWPAGVGAVLVVLVGLLSFAQLGQLFGDVWDAAATLIALFLLSEALDRNGFFNWAALVLARCARGSGWRLYGLVLLLTTGVTALLANDGAVLMLTPIYARLMLRIYPKDKGLAFLFAAGFFADALSGIFIPSNLTNIIIADANHLSFLTVAKWMALPSLAAFIAGGAAFAWRFRRTIAHPYDASALDEPATAIHNRVVFWWGWGALAFLIVGYSVGGQLHLPVSLIAGCAALIMVLVVRAYGLGDVRALVAHAPWSILIYALGMFVVINAAYDAGVLGFVTHPWQHAVASGAGTGGTLAAGGLAALLAAAVNNLP
ncbi:MAG: arsenical efflux pump membrane protein ArsB, partial [Ktedonobacterales bacterium]|nr:arsenical efflux pump membrane protein ArsB [Ktedonobacterales bacterium]